MIVYKTLFLVGQCIRLLHTDPWMAPNYRVEAVGQYSYEVRQLATSSISAHYTEVLKFEDQQLYETVECPKEEK